MCIRDRNVIFHDTLSLMSVYPRGEVHDRRAFLETTQQSLLEAFATPEVVESLGEEATERMVELCSLAVIPDVRNGRIAAALTSEDESIPLVALRPSEK